MRLVLLMVRKDLLRKLRAPLGIVVMLLFPVIFSLILAVTFGGGNVPRVHILVENRDDGLLGGAVLSALGSTQAAQFLDVEAVDENGLDRIEKGQGSALLRIPEGFTQNVIDGKPTSLELVRNPAQGIMPEIAEQVAGVLAEVLSAGSQVLRQPLQEIGGMMQSDGSSIGDVAFAEVALSIKGSIEGASKLLDPLVIELETVQLREATDEPEADDTDPAGSAPAALTIFLFVLPGVSVWSLFMIGDLAMRDILIESEDGTLRRQLQGPIHARSLVLAKAGYTAVTCLVGLAILTALGAIVQDRAVDPVAYLLLSLALILAITGSGAVVYGASGTQARGTTIASVLYLFLGFAGGSFISVDNMPRAVQAIAPISPFYWGTEGFKALLFGAGPAGATRSILVLALFGATMLVFGGTLMRRRMARGGFA